jgi:hypothetical protein
MLSCEIGDRFGKLSIIETWSEAFANGKKQKVCECKCDCGNTVVIRASALRHDGKKSCGCTDGRGSRCKCKPGEKYGMLTVLRSWSEKFPNHKSKEKVSECLCDCGKTIVVRSRYIRKGHKLSCGCLRLVNNSEHHGWKGHGEIGAAVWSGIKGSSANRSRKIPFELTIEQGWDLFLKQNRKCALSGVEIQFSKKNPRYEDAKNHTASLDRIDSLKGYTIDNVQWVHKEVNNMKQALPQKKFIEWCRLIANHNQ